MVRNPSSKTRSWLQIQAQTVGIPWSPLSHLSHSVFFWSSPTSFRLERWMNDDICLLFSLAKILSKISNISISSRKRSHIPSWENRKIIDSRVQGGRGYVILSCMEKMSQTLPSFRQLDLPYSLSSPWPGPGLWTSPALPASRRVSQCWHSLPAASVCGQRKNPSLGWMFCLLLFPAVSKIFQGEYSWRWNFLHLIFQV